MSSVIRREKGSNNLSGATTEYHIVGLEDWDFFETIALFLEKKCNAIITTKTDGITSRSWQFFLKGEYFMLEHHDDLGNWFYSCNDSQESELLEVIATDLEERLKHTKWEDS